MRNFISIMYGMQPNSNFSIFNKALITELPCLYNKYILNFLEDITLVHEESREMNVYYAPDNQRICITSGLMEYLWLLSYLHYELYLQTPWGNPEFELDCSRRPVEINFSQSQLAIIRRMRAIMKCENNVDWPAGVALPTYPYDVNDNTTESKASELMLHSLAVIILHELGHHVCFINNYNLPDLVEEMFCDWFAYTQFVELSTTNYLGIYHYDRAIQKRFFASLNVGCLLLNLNLNHGHGAIHPNGLSRLDTIIAHNSNILNLSNDKLYNPQEDKCDMRRVISYASFLISVSAQLWIEDNAKFVNEVQKVLSTTVFESPFYTYKSLRSLLCKYVEWKEQNINEHAFRAACSDTLSFMARCDN